MKGDFHNRTASYLDLFQPWLSLLVPALEGRCIDFSGTKASAPFAELVVLWIQRWGCCWPILSGNFAVPFKNVSLPCDFCSEEQIKETNMISIKGKSMMLAHSFHRWQTQGPWAESSPPPCFIWPGTLFLPGGSAKLLAPS